MKKVIFPPIGGINIYLGKPPLIDKAAMIKYCREVVRKIGGISPTFKGLIRFDLVPDGEGGIKGIYEINAHSPECIAAAAAMAEKGFGNGAEAVARFARAIKGEFGQRKIILIPGDCPVKKAFLPYLAKRLIKEGIKLEVTSPQEAMKKDFPPSAVIWRWGDLRIRGENQYPPKFAAWLERQRKRGVEVFNTLLPEKEDFSLKSRLPHYSLQTPKDVEWGVKNKEKLILKPYGGASGKNIFFGRDFSAKEWERILKEKKERGSYGLYDLLELPVYNWNFIIDLNPAFWAAGGEIKFLYAIIRVGEKGKLINVAQGGGIAAKFII